MRPQRRIPRSSATMNRDAIDPHLGDVLGTSEAHEFLEPPRLVVGRKMADHPTRGIEVEHDGIEPTSRLQQTDGQAGRLGGTRRR